MGNLVYTFAVLLVITWIIGYVGYGNSGLFHMLLVFAGIAVGLRLISATAIDNNFNTNDHA